MEIFLGQIMLWGGNFAPVGFLACEGQLLPISENEALFTLLGTTYGGDGINTFALPDLRNRIVDNWGQGPGLTNATLGGVNGTESNTITVQQMPAHTHSAIGVLNIACNSGDEKDSSTPVGCFPRQTAGADTYAATSNAVMGVSNLGNVTLSASGWGQPMNNLMPTLAMFYCIATEGIYPTQS